MDEVIEDRVAGLLLVGINYRSASPALRDQLFAEEPELAPLLSDLRGLDVPEALAISTCERLELIAVRHPGQQLVEPLMKILAKSADRPVRAIASESVCHEGEAALRHLFAVAASLESQVVGEPQVLGQLKECHRRAVEAGLVGPVIESSLRAAYGTAKRVRHETALAEESVSLASSALQVARSIHGALEPCNALLIGLGEMGELLATQFQAAGLEELVIIHASLHRAEETARRLGCHVRPWEELPAALAAADIVISDRGSGRWTVTRDLAEAALRARRRQPIFFVDAALPGDIESGVGELEGAFAYDLDDLDRMARQGKATREAASVAAWQILEQELADFSRQRAERAAVPLVTALRQHFEEARRQVLADPRVDAQTATRLLTRRLLHGPSEVLRRSAVEDPTGGETLEQAVRRLFRLDEQDAGGGGEDDR